MNIRPLRAVAKEARLLILQTHLSAAYAHIRSHGIETTRTFDYGRGHQHIQILGKEPGRGQPRTRAAYTQSCHLQLLASSFAFRTPYRTQGLSFLIDYKGSAPTSKFVSPTVPPLSKLALGSRSGKGYYLSEVCQIEGAETPKPRYRTGLITKSIVLTDLFT